MNPRATLHPEGFNAAQCALLLADLRAMDPPPVAIHEGRSEDEAWKEKGFTVTFPLGRAREAQAALVALGERYGQVALYMYEPRGDVLVQRVLPCCPEFEVVASEVEVGVAETLREQFQVFLDH
eukprot:TRINITY_DN28613_c0_g1_i1.p3 TRINITY_DN28613_c0_g1~~TRINITY_DN28613_c0_g1_i1.p3  ORF type:complete len:124 (+),score=20.97 TRINITY_DN28613_c0_g1_i1:248-619(+)